MVPLSPRTLFAYYQLKLDYHQFKPKAEEVYLVGKSLYRYLMLRKLRCSRPGQVGAVAHIEVEAVQHLLIGVNHQTKSFWLSGDIVASY